MGRFQVYTENTALGVKLMVDCSTMEVRIVDDGGYFKGKNVQDCEPSQVRALFPDVDEYVRLRSSDYIL